MKPKPQKSDNSELRVGYRVEVSNPKNKHFQKSGTITKRDRGNVWVHLDSGDDICTRASCLSDISPDPYNDSEFG